MNAPAAKPVITLDEFLDAVKNQAEAALRIVKVGLPGESPERMDIRGVREI